MKTRANYLPGSGAEDTEIFFDNLNDKVKRDGRDAVKATFDSVKNESGVSLPKSAEAVVAAVGEERAAAVLDAVVDGMGYYEREHGTLPTADVIEAALAQGLAASKGFKDLGIRLDAVGDTGHHDPLSAQPNRVVIAITAAMAEAIPFGTYMPADIGSNEARLGIVSHTAGSNFGDYDQNELLDGINIGDDYLSAERVLTLSVNGGGASGTPLTGQFRTQSAAGSGVPLLRNRTFLAVNGLPVAFESSQQTKAATGSIAGVVNLGGTDYALSGTVTYATGNLSVTATPALPAGTEVYAHGFIDYEADPTLTPEIYTGVQVYQLFCTPWRGKAKQTIDSSTQYINEIGLNLLAESVMSLRNQFSNERHYKALRYALRVAQKNNVKSFDFDKATQIAQKDRAQIWLNLIPVLAGVSQKMAEDTMDHGVTHLYVTKNIAVEWMGLPSELWTPSGLVDRAGLFRIGRLFGRYDVYYTPKVLVEAAATGQILCIGRSTQPARCPIVLADAVPPTMLPLAFNDDLKNGTGFYGRNLTAVNPHTASAKGVALINVSGL